MTLARQSRLGRSVLLIALCASAVAGCMREKDRLDEEVRQLCAKDGGIKVYEEVEMPAASFDEFGVAKFLDATEMRPLGNRFDLYEETKYFKKGSPSLRREHAKIVRSADGKLLGESTSYHRVGGDFPGPWHDSSFACPANVGTAKLKQSVFRIQRTVSRP